MLLKNDKCVTDLSVTHFMIFVIAVAHTAPVRRTPFIFLEIMLLFLLLIKRFDCLFHRPGIIRGLQAFLQGER